MHVPPGRCPNWENENKKISSDWLDRFNQIVRNLDFETPKSATRSPHSNKVYEVELLSGEKGFFRPYFDPRISDQKDANRAESSLGGPAGANQRWIVAWSTLTLVGHTETFTPV